jgi:hypothetical protein
VAAVIRRRLKDLEVLAESEEEEEAAEEAAEEGML